MSAFICNDEQFEAVVNGWNLYCVYKKSEDLQVIADELKRENIRSVNYRYDENTEFEPCKFTALPKGSEPPHSREQLINWLDCIDYQSCECPDYEQSKAFAWINKMQADLYYEIRKRDKWLTFDLLSWTLPY